MTLRQTRDSVTDIWGDRAPFHGEGEWPVRVDERVMEEPDEWVQSACVLCSNGCGLDIGVKDGRMVGVRGRASDRVNHGRLGPKGLHGWVANDSKDRLTRPLVRSGDRFREASWDEAMDLVVRRAQEVIEERTELGLGFYTSGQLFAEEYYTLATIARGGLGTPHLDGNTRLCTATAAMALMQTFGADGQPGSYRDLDTAETILHAGHNVASQQTVLWARILDRLHGPNPPRLVVIDPRETATAREAAVHLAPVPGTNLALMNGLLNLVIQSGRVDHEYIDRHTVGFEKLAQTVSHYPPDRVEEITGVPARKLEEAAELLGTTSSLTSTVLQGFYQSHLATASSVQVNNLHLVRGLIGKPGCGILQMNGQPTAQNTRETGCDGALPGFRNWDDPLHIRELAEIWNVDPDKIPAWAPPTHAMQMMRYAEQGSIRFLWVSGTNPAVSLPDLKRIRKILKSESLFVVVQDAFMTETAELADVVLPAAIWGEKTGTFTNTDRTVHLSLKAVDPPGEARPDLDIFIDFARRMDLRDKDGEPLIKWNDPESAFEAWKKCSRGRPCDYSGITYQKLRGSAGIQWPCNDEYPDGRERLYDDSVFPTRADYCQTYGHDLETGAVITQTKYRADDPDGKAILKDAEFSPMPEEPDEEFPMWLTTGRIVHQFHTRTKTGRASELQQAAPDAFVQVSAEDAASQGVEDGDMVEVESRRGKIRAPARIGDIRQGLVFVPFHFGYWDNPDRPRAANELTLTGWDPVSKQPFFKFAAVQLRRVDQ